MHIFKYTNIIIIFLNNKYVLKEPNVHYTGNQNVSLLLYLKKKLNKKYCEGAKGCPEYLSLHAEVSSCFLPKGFLKCGQKLSLVRVEGRSLEI